MQVSFFRKPFLGKPECAPPFSDGLAEPGAGIMFHAPDDLEVNTMVLETISITMFAIDVSDIQRG